MTKADVEKARTNSHQKRQQAEESKNDYSNKLVKFNEQQKTHHYELVPTIINQYQNAFVKNVDEFRMTLNKLVAAEEKFRKSFIRLTRRLSGFEILNNFCHLILQKNDI